MNGIGDEAYLDAQHGLHVRKGKVRFFISAKAANDKQLRDPPRVCGTIVGGFAEASSRTFGRSPTRS